MPRPLIPPRGIFIASSVVFHAKLKAQIRDTLIQLMALAWASNSHTTPPLSYPQLSTLTGKSIKTLYGHIAVLRNEHAALRLQRAGSGVFLITFADWLYHPQSVSKNRQLPVKEEDCDSVLPEKRLTTTTQQPPIPHDSLDHASQKTPNKAPKPQSQNPLSDSLRQKLLQAGVFPSLLDEIANSGYDEKELDKLLAWVTEERPENPAALFIGRMRAGARAPERFDRSACPYCGKRGSHTPDCRYRYVQAHEWEEYFG